MRGQADYLLMLMQAEPWLEFWADLGLVLQHFEDVGLLPTATDLEVWQRCQMEQLVLLTVNRNQSGPDSLEATIRLLNQPDSLPVFTVADLDKLNNSRAYADLVVETLLDHLQRIEELRGTGRLYLP